MAACVVRGPLALCLAFLLSTASASSSSSSSDTDSDQLAVLLSKRGYPCYVEEKQYEHGEMFSLEDSPCITYRCNSGSYDLYEEGCEQWGRCWAVGETHEHQCQLFQCFATPAVGGLKTYLMRPIVQKLCPDHMGNCRSPGEVFDLLVEGKPKLQCYCDFQQGQIKYHCQ